MDAANDFVSMKDLARSIGLDRSSTLKYVKREGYNLTKRRDPGTRGQYAVFVSSIDAEAIVSQRRDEFSPQGESAIRSDLGVFYLIRLVPELSHSRIKLGFAATLAERMRAHLTTAPTAEVVRWWPCRRTWELAAIDSLSREGCRPLSGEVFDCDDVDSLVSRGNSFFSLMPTCDV